MWKVLKYIGISVGSLFLLLLIIGMIAGKPTPPPVTASSPANPSRVAAAEPPAPAPAPAPSPAPSMPEAEAAMISAVQTAMTQTAQAANDMQIGGIRARRAQGICTAIKSLQITSWIGRVTKVSANSDGKGVLTVELADNIVVKTWNNDLSDIGSKTLIEPTSALFQKASMLREGQSVRFSGSFIKGDVDCVRESSMTLKGSMEEPDFIFRFSDIAPL